MRHSMVTSARDPRTFPGTSGDMVLTGCVYLYSHTQRTLQTVWAYCSGWTQRHNPVRCFQCQGTLRQQTAFTKVPIYEFLILPPNAVFSMREMSKTTVRGVYH